MSKQNLDEQIKSMMCKSKNILQGKTWECKVCGKEGIKDAISTLKHTISQVLSTSVKYVERQPDPEML